MAVIHTAKEVKEIINNNWQESLTKSSEQKTYQFNPNVRKTKEAFINYSSVVNLSRSFTYTIMLLTVDNSVSFSGIDDWASLSLFG